MHITSTSIAEEKKSENPPFSHIIVIKPLGFLYGSAGKFLSPENLVGRSGTSFPPSAATLSGIFAASLPPDKIKNLQLAGPFWAWSHNPQNFYVPTPFNCLVKDKKIHQQIAWFQQCKDPCKGRWLAQFRVWQKINGELVGLDLYKTPPNDKFESKTWLPIRHWKRIRHKINKDKNLFKETIPQEENCFPQLKVESPPWEFVPHLHPRLQEDQRRVIKPEEERERGSLFLENGVQLNPDACLVYLSNISIPDGWYRFGGEGHLVDLRCENICQTVTDLLKEKLGHSFALITPAVWGSNRLSYREPMVQENQDKNGEWVPAWKREALLTERSIPFRYRLGNPQQSAEGEKRKSNEKLLSRGRYAMPAGSVYVLEKPLPSWQEWDKDWFPKEGVSFKRWGCGLSLPLESALVQESDPQTANTSEISLGDN